MEYENLLIGSTVYFLLIIENFEENYMYRQMLHQALLLQLYVFIYLFSINDYIYLYFGRVQKKQQLHGCELEEGFFSLCQFEEGSLILHRNLA